MFYALFFKLPFLRNAQVNKKSSLVLFLQNIRKHCKHKHKNTVELSFHYNCTQIPPYCGVNELLMYYN